MVNEQEFDEEFEITDNDHHELGELELSEEEATEADKMKQLRQKITRLTEEKQQVMEEAARERADFLNARRRLETERAQDKIRSTKKHIEALLPLADSFEMARSDEDTWKKADENWRKGIEGIHSQLQSLIESNAVTVIDPQNKTFDPHKHEAISLVPVTNKTQHDTVITVLQKGYEMDINGVMEVIRPARVIIGEFTG